MSTMGNNETLTIETDSEKEVIREDIEFHYFSYLIILFTVYLTSFLVPAFLFLAYIFLFFLPNFLEISNFFSLFLSTNSLVALISMPLIIIGCYLIRLFFIALLARAFWRMSEKKSPTKSGIIPRNFSSKTLDEYHKRSFLIKYPKNIFTKGIFPWLSNWLFNFMGASKIGKGSTLEESVCNDKFLEVGKNVYIGANSTLTSHLVEGIFGNIAYFKIKVGDNVTAPAANMIAPGVEINNNSYLLPLASAAKHSILKGKSYYWGIPLRRIFKKKIMKFLKLNESDLSKDDQIRKNQEIIETGRIIENQSNHINTSKKPYEQKENYHSKDIIIDFTTSSAISRVNVKFLVIYIPIFWLSGMLVTIMFYTFTYYLSNWILIALFIPAMIILMWFTFIIACFFFSKLFLVLINLIHKPKEGIFKAVKGDHDFEFWCLRTELKKIVFWLMRNWPLPWMDILAFKWFGINMTISSSLHDSWCDGEFINFGRRVLIGQGSTIMSSMVIGKYLIIKRVICDDYSLVGGHTTIAPGTIVGKDTFVSAISNTVYNQILEPGWIYMGIPVVKFKPNKYAETRRAVIMKKDVDKEKKYEVEHEVNIEKEKEDLI